MGGVRLGGAAAAGGARAALAVRLGVGAALAHSVGSPAALSRRLPDGPFMNEMDEISYWVYTKRAPCLMNYDNLIKKQNEVAQAAKKCKSDRSVTEEVPSPKKKKRKLSLFEEDSVSVTKQQNVYFEASQNKERTVLSSCKSDTLESDIDFNIKNSSIQGKPKKVKGQKNGRTLHKKNKVVTSTPLRRSQRKAQNCINNNIGQLNISFETYNSSLVHENNITKNPKPRSKKSSIKVPGADKILNCKGDATPLEKPKNDTMLNGQFEDLSDVSGFTANYIRSTKLHSNSKPHRSLRSKTSRTIPRVSQQNQLTHNNTTMLVCVNKSVNATADLPHTSVLNCSTDSSQNVINLITTKSNDKNSKVDKSTSLLKFVNAKIKGSDSNIKLESSASISRTDKDVSVQSNSRYPKRHKNHSTEDVTRSSSQLNLRQSTQKRKPPCGNVVETNNSHWKENPSDSSLSKTRSGRNLALSQRHIDKAVLVYSNSTEQASSLNTMNVASQPGDLARTKSKAKRVVSHKNVKKSIDKSGLSLQKDAVRDKSGFAACFSDTDDESATLKQKKFFC